MSSEDTIEIEGASVEDAIKQALEQLGAQEDDVSVEILSTPRSGLLGLGSRPAKVRVSRRPAEGASSGVSSPPERRSEKREMPRPERRPPSPPADNEDRDRSEPERVSAELEEQAREAKAVLEQVLELMGEKAEVVQAATDADGIELEIKGDGSGILIGRHGQTLDALEYVINRLVARKIKEGAPVVLDTEAYRARRRQQLERMALAMGERAKREHQAVSLDPMPPRDRRIIHLTLKDDPLVVTRSSGSGYLRSLEIAPVEGGRERGPRASDEQQQQRERDPIGQQGGFKHGQKRIV